MDNTKPQPSRQKYWSELKSDEKIERLREQVKSVQYRQQGMEELLQRLNNHSHLPDGSIVVPLHGDYPQQVHGSLRWEKDDEVYF